VKHGQKDPHPNTKKEEEANEQVGQETLNRVKNDAQQWGGGQPDKNTNVPEKGTGNPEQIRGRWGTKE